MKPILKVKYHGDVEKIKILDNRDFVDLCSAEEVILAKDETKLINLGVSIKLPDGYWAQLVPRSSTFKKYGIIQTNSFGVIDNSYCGDSDIWKMPVYAVRNTVIPKGARICQFRIVKQQNFIIQEVDKLEDNNRGGFGSTGI